MWELVIVAAVVLGGVMIYNGLVRLRERADGAWSDVDVQLKRRHDLIPNLVETVKGYAGHERQTLDSVIRARSSAMAAEGPVQKGEAEGLLTNALRSLFALSESYPDLQAATNFRDLQASLVRVEDDIQKARRYFNAVIRDYNTKVGQVPSNVVARAFGFRPRSFFEMPEGERTVPQVSFEEGGRAAAGTESGDAGPAAESGSGGSDRPPPFDGSGSS